MPTPNKKWEEEFEKKFNMFGKYPFEREQQNRILLDEIKSFIRQTLVSQKAKIVEKLKGMKLTWKHPLDPDIDWKGSYNTAIDDIITSITEKGDE